MTVPFKITEKQSRYIFILFFLVAFILVIGKPMRMASDSQSYLTIDIMRSAGYPLFLTVIKYIFGSYFNLATLIIQFGLGTFSIYFFIMSLKKNYKLNLIWYIILTLILLVPYIYNHHLANSFLSEALSYPLYLISVTHFLISIITSRTKSLIISLPILFILILTRNQFLILIPVAICIFLWISIKQKELKSKWLLIVLIAFPFITSIADKTYHKIVHGFYVNTPWTGIHLITPAFFVSDADDYLLFDSEKEQTYFKNVYKSLYIQNLNINNLEDSKEAILVYIDNYSRIANATIFSVARKSLEKSLTYNQKVIAIDKLTKSMTLNLIQNNFALWFKIYIQNFIHGFGNAKYTLLLLVIFIYSFLKLIKTNSISYKIIFLVLFLTFLNTALVSIGMHTKKRFLFYNDWVFFLIIFILFKTSKNSKTALS
ncbi:hypothetical protein Q4Q34_12470 [Flavivirga abyssicola]|uniref:hypothetical protein n=1 Tax=Flavivirga abyssicola TaxID=3063533 RepID=UPI0026E0D5C4|nr:hypothetical protein [Flavivirga sp. MEBiC07777]WVK12037.1 hypothetical protein Q4Q34_12470 [Flavivirga sp. MEBiC07777]